RSFEQINNPFIQLFTTNDCMDAGGRATQEQLPRHEEHEGLFLDAKRDGVCIPLSNSRSAGFACKRKQSLHSRCKHTCCELFNLFQYIPWLDADEQVPRPVLQVRSFISSCLRGESIKAAIWYHKQLNDGSSPPFAST
ncbi:MAG: hypothetical protein WAW41_16245, partial [Methylobacter sp.]